MAFRKPWGPGIVLGALVAAGAASAQAPAATDGRAIDQASDAFGIRVGVEQIGLYNESQVRSFNLQDTGNFRVNGAYFAKTGGLVDSILSGVVTRVGLNALDSDFASPSGVVEYRLRSPFDMAPLQLEVSRREHGGLFLEAAGAYATEDGRLGGLIGGQINETVTSSGLNIRYERLGALAEWRPAEGMSLIGFGSLNIFDLGGFYGVQVTGDRAPPAMRHPGRYVPVGSDHDGRDINLGLLGTTRLRGDLEASGSVIYSWLELDRADFTLLSVDENGLGLARTTSNRPRLNEAWSGSAALSWRHAPGRRAYAEIRARSTSSAFSPAASFDMGPFDLSQGLSGSIPDAPPPLPRTFDETEQLTAGLGYEATLGRLRLKGRVMKTAYERHVSAPDQPVRSSDQSPWLYDLSAVLAINPSWTAFASATRGLEDSGVAPGNAANRDEILPVALANQQELGVRGRLTDRLTLIGSLFSIDKPAAGFDANNVYSMVGELRHRGAELSLVGHLTPELRVVAGAVYLEARRSGEPVDNGVWSAEATGVPDVQAMLGLTYAAPWAPGLSFDGQVNYSSARRLRSRDELRTPDLTTVDVGFRYAFEVADKNLTLRGRVLNLFDEDQWTASRSEAIDRPARRGARISLAMSF